MHLAWLINGCYYAYQDEMQMPIFFIMIVGGNFCNLAIRPIFFMIFFRNTIMSSDEPLNKMIHRRAQSITAWYRDSKSMPSITSNRSIGMTIKSAKNRHWSISMRTKLQWYDNSQSRPKGTPTLKVESNGSYSNPSMLTNRIDIKR